MVVLLHIQGESLDRSKAFGGRTWLEYLRNYKKTAFEMFQGVCSSKLQTVNLAQILQDLSLTYFQNFCIWIIQSSSGHPPSYSNQLVAIL